MAKLAELQRSFLRFLLGQESDFVDHVLDHGGVSARTRSDIYRNGYRLRLRDVLESDHEILGYYLGDELFDQMAEGYIDRYPSCYASLRHFADRLPELLRSTPPFSDHPVIAELAAFERLLLFAFDAGETARVHPNILPSLPTESWPSMRIRFHPSAQLFEARWNSVEIWQALKAERPPPEAATQDRHWLVWRNQERVTEFRPLEAPELDALCTAIAGNDFATLCERLLQWHAPEDIGGEALGLLRTWLGQGIVRQLVTDPAISPVRASS